MLVVGFGNSGGEIALDLANAGADVALAVRGPVQILPRDLLGFPILSWAILYRRLPARLVDVFNAPILRLAVGNIERLGLRRAAKGPRQMVEQDGRVPLIDARQRTVSQGLHHSASKTRVHALMALRPGHGTAGKSVRGVSGTRVQPL